MDDIRKELVAHGRARSAARAKAKRETEAIRALAPRALEAGVSKTEVARLAQVSRPALDELLRSA